MEKKINLHANHRQRLKNRALKEGLDAFEPHNVLELMLFYVLPHVDTNDIAHELINRFGSFDAVFSAPEQELMKVKGIKNHAASFIKLIPEFSRYYAAGHNDPQNPKPTVEEIKSVFISNFLGRTNECVMCMFFDSEGVLIDTKLMFSGSINSVSFSYRELVNEALSLNSYKVAVAHNHPTGSPMPSPDDVDTYKRLRYSLAQVNVELIDSYVISGNKCSSTFDFICSSGTIGGQNRS